MKITNDNIQEILFDYFLNKGFTVTQRTYGSVWDIKMPNTNASERISIETDRYGVPYVEVGFSNRKVQHHQTAIKNLEKSLNSSIKASESDRLQVENQKTAIKMLETFGFTAESLSFYTYDRYVGVSTALENFNDDIHLKFNYSIKNKIKLQMFTDGKFEYNIETKNLNIALLQLVDTKLQAIKEAWEFSVL